LGRSCERISKPRCQGSKADSGRLKPGLKKVVQENEMQWTRW